MSSCPSEFGTYENQVNELVVTPSHTESPSLDQMKANDHMGVYIRRCEDSRDLKKNVEGSRRFRGSREEYGR